MEIELFSLQSIEALTIYSFIIIIFLIVIRYFIFSKDIENKGIAKIIGGFTVFIVALLSNHPFVILVSLFIGGLLIATEDFMKQLAIIFRSESKDIGENLKPVNATPKEIKEKQKQEIHETIEILEEQSVNHVKINPSDLIHFEEQVRNYWRKLFKESFDEDIKLFDSSGNEIVVDGILTSKYKDTIEYIFEIRVVSSFNEIDNIVKTTYINLQKVFPVPLIFSFISLRSFTVSEIKKLEKIKKDDISLVLFEVKNKKVLPKL